jgi:NAD(P)-dependent dehydrogenase (short-subunit alcohol dehydrogenase family)
MPERVVVVTGASGGIGRATAVAFAARGDRVALLARGESGLQAAATRYAGPAASRSSCPPTWPTPPR